jgi:N-formylglutamate amidohydrolase
MPHTSAPTHVRDTFPLVEPHFVVLPPRAAEIPVVVEVPHAGLSVPPHFATGLLASARAIARDADLFVDELYADAVSVGATLLVSRVSRYVVDLNRAETDVDDEAVVDASSSLRAPRGVVWRLTTDNERCLAAPLRRDELEVRLDEVYRPYHAALARLIEGKVTRFGVCVLVAGHSMPSVGRSGHGDSNVERADVVPGTQGRTTAASVLLDVVERQARSAGLSIKHDEPYRGGYATRRWGRPHEGVHAVQVEMARRLYMDETTLLKTNAFPATQAFACELVRKLGEACQTLG